jgi:SOS-response transcriptional repressor LexA
LQKEFFPPNRGALIYRPTRDVGKRRESSPRKKSKREKEFNPLKSSAAPAKWIELETHFKRIFDECVSLGQN